MSELAWQKSSFSSGDGNTTCIEVAGVSPHTLRVRESDDSARVIAPGAGALSRLLRHLKAGGGTRTC